MKVVIASGKGGTGKTTIAINLATYISSLNQQPVRLLDCDVEAPNAHLFIKPNYSHEYKVTVKRPFLNKKACTACGKCVSACNYNVFAKIKNDILVFPELCHSCGTCFHLCPKQALLAESVEIGKIQLSENNNSFYFGQGVLNIGESAAPVVITTLKKHCIEQAFNIIDASPGTSCSVVKAMEGSDVAILVTEPTPFGLSDLKLAINLTAKLGISTGVIINRSFNDDLLITNFCQKHNVPVIGKIPFQKEYAESYSRGEILINHFPELEHIFANIVDSIYKIKDLPPHKIKKDDIHIISPYKDKEFNTFAQEHKVNELVIVSGKGGTGKTTIAGAIAELINNKIIADVDVDASNLPLVLDARIIREANFIGGKKYFIDASLCTSCGICKEHCQFNAIKTSPEGFLAIDKLACEGCGFCEKICPVQAILSKDSVCGKWYESSTNVGPLSHAKLEIGEENSGKLVAEVRKQAKYLANKHHADFILNDGPPGTGCPVISSITGASLILIVTEPTISGIHDMIRVLELANHFGIPAVVAVNKADLNLEQTHKIKEIALQHKSQVIAEIPFDIHVVQALMQGKTIIKYGKGTAIIAIHQLWNALKVKLKQIK